MKVISNRPASEPSRFKIFLRNAGIIAFLLACAGLGASFSILGNFYGTRDLGGLINSLGKTGQALRDPGAAFPGSNSLNILCVGLDRNIVSSRILKHNGQPSTRNSRTDVMMVAHVDLLDRSVSILSIPRDTRVRLPGDRYHSKINDAHARGGIELTVDTVEEFLGVPIDHYLVVKQEAVEKTVDALGGLRIRVEKDMDYDDNWGQLHIHLKEGDQTLTGAQIAGYMRFRKDREGDFGRIRRQQQVIQALAGEVRNPSVLLKANSLIQEVRRQIKTDLSPDQQLALAYLLQSAGQERLQTVSLPIADTPIIGGVSYVEADDARKENLVNWLFRGDDGAMNRLIDIELRNASGDRALYEKTALCLSRFGFRIRRAGSGGDASGDRRTRVIQQGNLRGAARRIVQVLGLGMDVERQEGKGPQVVFHVGEDLRDNRILNDEMLWPIEGSYENLARTSRPSTRQVRRPRVRLRSAPAQVRDDGGDSDSFDEPAALEPAGDETSGSEPAAEPAPVPPPAPPGGTPPTPPSPPVEPGENNGV